PPPARIPRPPHDHRRDQRLVLLPATADQLPPMVRRDPGGLHLRGQGQPLHHPHEEAERRGTAARQLLRFRRAPPRREAGTDPLAVPGPPRLRRGAVRTVPRTPAAEHGAGRRAGPPPRRTTAGPELDPRRSPPTAPLRLRGAAPELLRRRVRPPA